jgi:hypothetical protein
MSVSLFLANIVGSIGISPPLVRLAVTLSLKAYPSSWNHRLAVNGVSTHWHSLNHVFRDDPLQVIMPMMTNGASDQEQSEYERRKTVSAFDS